MQSVGCSFPILERTAFALFGLDFAVAVFHLILKSHSNNYLEQKRIKNLGESTYLHV